MLQEITPQLDKLKKEKEMFILYNKLESEKAILWK